MTWVPNIGPAKLDRQRLIGKLEADLLSLQRIPARRRESELADIREEVYLAVFGDLNAGLALRDSPGQLVFGVVP